MPALLERPKMTEAMAAALKHHILKERERKRQEEEEADKAIERKKEERERQRKKAEAESLNLEETKEQIKKLGEKLENLQKEKHELFLQLKKVLNEDENRRRQKMKEQSDREFFRDMGHTSYHSNIHPMTAPHVIMHGGMSARGPLLGDSPKGHLFRQTQTSPSHTGVKRARSPSPPVVQLYPSRPQGYPQGYPASYQTTATYQQGHSSYNTGKSSTNYTSQSHVTYPGAQQQSTHSNYPANQSTSSKYQGSQSAFSSFSGHYVPAQQPLNDKYPQNYQQQQQQQQQPPPQRYVQSGQHNSSMSMQQQLEHANQQSGFTEEQGHFKLQQQQQQQQQQPSSSSSSSSAAAAAAAAGGGGGGGQPQSHIRPTMNTQPHHQTIHTQPPQQPPQPRQSLLSQQQLHLNKPSIVGGFGTRQTRPSSPIYHQKQQPAQPQLATGYQSPRHGHPSNYIVQQQQQQQRQSHQQQQQQPGSQYY